LQVVGSALQGNETDVFYKAIGVAMDAYRVMDGREAAVESAVVQFPSPGSLKVVNQVLLAFIPYNVDKGIGEFRVFIEYFEVRCFREGQMDGKEARV